MAEARGGKSDWQPLFDLVCYPGAGDCNQGMAAKAAAALLRLVLPACGCTEEVKAEERAVLAACAGKASGAARIAEQTSELAQLLGEAWQAPAPDSSLMQLQRCVGLVMAGLVQHGKAAAAVCNYELRNSESPLAAYSASAMQ